MNSTNLKIITHLRKNSRHSVVNIAKNLEMPVSTVYDKLNRLQKEGIIKKHSTIVDFPKIGYNHQVKFVLKIEHSQIKELLNFLKKHQNVNSIYEINSEFDFLVETVHRNIKEYLAFQDGLEENFKILKLQEHQIINEIEKETFLELNK